MPLDIGLYSYGTASLAYTCLAGLLLIRWRNQVHSLPMLVATAATAVWAAIIATGTQLTYPPVTLIQAAEVARNATWIFFLMSLESEYLRGSGHVLSGRRWLPWFIAGLALVVLALFATPLLEARGLLTGAILDNAVYGTWLAMAIIGLLLLEQVFRNSTPAERWSTKHLCLGLGFLFAYDFFMYAEGLLFRQLDAVLWQSRGLAIALATPLLGIAISRTLQNKTEVVLSRHAAFHTITLLAAGVYLIFMALVGYFVRYLGGTWGGALQIAFLSAAGLLLLVLLFSGQIRAKTRVWLSKHFFSYRYDYRLEWLRFTRTLAEGGGNTPAAITRAVAQLCQSPGGILWAREESDRFVIIDSWNMDMPEDAPDLRELADWLERSDWIIDLEEWQHSPDIYTDLVIPDVLQSLHRGWLIIPLMLADRAEGILLLKRSDLHQEVNWEDRDLLKVAGRQAASHLAQYRANQALVESRQFEAFNRLSAYVVHDLKNILAQQSLIVSNASKFRHNPEFMDDVIETVGNSVERMTRLMEQMRSGLRGETAKRINVATLLRETVADRARFQPEPALQINDAGVLIEADREQLATVFTHIIQNAQEATAKDGEISVRLMAHGNGVEVAVQDNGIGMDEQFIRDRLFKPFDSTKGLTGMGIGAYESREFVRSLGGDIRVSSEPNVGTRFVVMLPCAGSSPEVDTKLEESTIEQG